MVASKKTARKRSAVKKVPVKKGATKSRTASTRKSKKVAIVKETVLDEIVEPVTPKKESREEKHLDIDEMGFIQPPQRERSKRAGILLLGIAVGTIGAYLVVGVDKDQLALIDSVPIHEVLPNITVSTIQTPDHPDDFSDIDLTTFWEVWRILEKSHIPPPNEDEETVQRPTREEFVQGAINGLTYATKDRHTIFLEQTDADEFTDEIVDGEIQGIGAYIGKPNGILTIIRPITNGPAHQAGLQKEDIILKIDGEKIDHLNLIEATDNIRGVKGSSVVLDIYRGSTDKKFSVSVERDRVIVPSVETETLENILVIRLLTVNNKTPRAFQLALKEFVTNPETDRILLDLRGNPGGVLEAAVYIAGLFLPKKSVVLHEYDGTEVVRRYRSTTGPLLGPVQPPMVVLVDRGTASSAEIIAAALAHYNVATVVGVPTFGKGSVQSLSNVATGGLLKITIAHWLTPAKKSLSDGGFKPTIDITKGRRNYIRQTEEEDLDIEQYELDRAIEELQKK